MVTGAGGFIGSHLVEHLAQQGADVKAFVRYNSRNDPGLLRHLPSESRRVEIMAGDLKDSETVRRVLKDMHVVFHLGALVAIPYSYQSPLDFVQTNVFGTVHVLTAALAAGVERVVHTSTSEVYGTARYVPIDEDHPLQGQSPYSASKIAADKFAESFYRSFGLPVSTVRPFNAYGPRQSARAVIPTIITQALRGDVIRLGSLHPTRDFTYVRDLVDGFVRVAEDERTVGRVLNLGSGEETSVEQLVALIGSLLGKTLRIEVEERRVRPPLSEVERLIADTRLAQDVLGWGPRVSLPDGLGETIAWVRNHLDLYQPGEYVI